MEYIRAMFPTIGKWMPGNGIANNSTASFFARTWGEFIGAGTAHSTAATAEKSKNSSASGLGTRLTITGMYNLANSNPGAQHNFIDGEFVSFGPVLPDLEVIGRRPNYLGWGYEMERRFGFNSPLADNFMEWAHWGDPYSRARMLGASPFVPDAVALTIPISFIGITGFSGSLNIGIVGDEMGIWINGGYNVGTPDVGIGLGLTLGQYKGTGRPTFNSYMGYGQSWGGGLGLFGSYSKGYAAFGDPNNSWQSFYGGIGASTPSGNWSPMNYNIGWSFKFR